MPTAPSDPDPRPTFAIRDSTAPAVGGGGCSAAERGSDSPVLGAAYTQPFRWEVVPEPNPGCATTGPVGEAETREAAETALHRALSTYAAGFGFLYEVTGHPPDVRELARVPIRAPDPKPPTW